MYSCDSRLSLSNLQKCNADSCTRTSGFLSAKLMSVASDCKTAVFCRVWRAQNLKMIFMRQSIVAPVRNWLSRCAKMLYQNAGDRKCWLRYLAEPSTPLNISFAKSYFDSLSAIWFRRSHLTNVLRVYRFLRSSPYKDRSLPPMLFILGSWKRGMSWFIS